MTQVEADGALPTGAELGPYRVEARLGAGGMSVLYRATEVALDRPIALKVMAGSLSEDAAFRDRFVREARSASAIEHPNVIPIYATGDIEGRLYIAMRLVPDARDLRKLLVEEGAMTVERTAAVLSQAAAALDECHVHGLVHRDVKPDNLLLAPDDDPALGPHLYLTDFGVTRARTQARLTQDGQVLGTLAYAPPEQLRGEEVDARADVYSLGVTWYECLAGRRPFVRSNEAALLYAQLSEEPPSIVELRPDLPAEVDPVLRRALAKSPSDRFASCGALVDAMRRATGVTSPVRPSAPPTRPIDRPPPGPPVEGPLDRGVDLDATTRGRAAPDPADGSPVVDSVVETEERGSSRRAWPLRVGAGVLALVVVAGFAIFVARRGDDGAFHLPRLTAANGLTVDRTWQLTGAGGDRFEASTEIANPTDRTVAYTHDEVFPKSLAPAAVAIHASPTPDRVVVDDPVLRWKRDLGPHEKLVLRFSIDVPADGASAQRLQGWVNDRRRTESAYAKTPEARESQTPFEDDGEVEVAAPLIDGTGSTPDGAADTAPLDSVDPGQGTEPTGTNASVTGPTVSVTPTKPPTTPTSFRPVTVTTPTTKQPYSPASTPQPDGTEQGLIDDVNGLRANPAYGAVAAPLATDGHLIDAARTLARSNASVGRDDKSPVPMPAGGLGLVVVARSDASLPGAWAIIESSGNDRGFLKGAYQFVGASAAFDGVNRWYVVVVAMRVR